MTSALLRELWCNAMFELVTGGKPSRAGTAEPCTAGGDVRLSLVTPSGYVADALIRGEHAADAEGLAERVVDEVGRRTGRWLRALVSAGPVDGAGFRCEGPDGCVAWVGGSDAWFADAGPPPVPFRGSLEVLVSDAPPNETAVWKVPDRQPARVGVGGVAWRATLAADEAHARVALSEDGVEGGTAIVFDAWFDAWERGAAAVELASTGQLTGSSARRATWVHAEALGIRLDAAAEPTNEDGEDVATVTLDVAALLAAREEGR